MLEQVIVAGAARPLTNALWDIVWRPANALRACDDAQRERYLLPGIRGERRDCVAVTERDAGSDPSAIATTAERVPAAASASTARSGSSPSATSPTT